MADTVGLEALSQGAQMVFVTDAATAVPETGTP